MNVQNKKQPIDLTFSGEQLNLATAHTNYTGLLENITSWFTTEGMEAETYFFFLLIHS